MRSVAMDGYEAFKLGISTNPWVGVNGIKAEEWYKGYNIAKKSARTISNINYNCDAGTIPAFG